MYLSIASTWVRIRDRVAPSLITFGAYVAAGYLGNLWLSRVTDLNGGNVSAELAIPWLAPGVGVLCMYKYGRGTWPAIAVGSFVVWGVIRGLHPPMIAVESLGEALSIVLIVTLLRRSGFHPTLDRYKDSLLLLGVLAVGRTVTFAIDVLGVVGSAWYSTDPQRIAGLAAAGAARHGDVLVISAELLRFSARWWANTVAGCLLVVPLLALRARAKPSRRQGYFVELMLLLVGVALWIMSGLVLPSGGIWLVLLLPAAYLLVAWAAIRFGVGAAMGAVLLFALASSSGFGFQIGTFAGLNSRQSLEAAWGFIGLLIATSLFLTALLAQRARTLRIIAASGERYRQLFFGSPYPMWTEDPESGRILLANPAALRTYGYMESEFQALCGRDLAVDAHRSAAAEPGRVLVSVDRHRTRSGAEIDVEIRSVIAQLDDHPVRICCVELLNERNQLRHAVMSAGDIERFRLGDIIERQLMPLLASLSQATERLRKSPVRDAASERVTLAAVNATAEAAARICTRLTRGASPLQWADGNLAEALARLPGTRPAGGPELRVSIQSTAELLLPVERCDHIYRLVEEAVQSAAGRPGAKNVWVILEVTTDCVRVMIEDDGEAPVPNDPAAEVALRSVTARAVGALGQLEIGRSWAGGRLVSFRCAQGQDAASRAVPLVPEGGVASPTPLPTATAATAAPAAAAKRSAEAAADLPQPTRGRWWIGIAILALAIVVAVPMDGYLTATDPSNYWYGSVLPLPWIPIGLGVAALLVGGVRLWPIGCIFALILDLWIEPGGWQLQVVDAAGLTLSIVWTVRLLRRMQFRMACDRFHDLLVLGAAATLGQAAYAALSLIAVLLIAALVPSALPPELHALIDRFDALYQAIPAIVEGMFRWWVAGVTGIMLGVPAVISWSPRVWQRVVEHKLEVLCWMVAVGAEQMTLLTLSGADWRLPILAGCITIAVWAAVRFGAALAWSATLLVALSATISFVLQRGALAAESGGEGVTVLWGFIVLAAATVGVVTTLLAESEQAENHLRQLNQRYRALFDAVPHSLFAIANPSGRIRLSNNRAREFYGYSSAEFEAMSLADLEVGGGDPMPALAEPFKTTRRHIDKSGRILDVELALTPVEFDDGPGALCFSIDVTERNRLRTQMIESTDSERRRLALEFHDGLGQILTGLLLGIQPLLRSTEKQKPLDNAAIDFVSGAGREALAACARILRGISPLQETGGDLLAALRRIPDHLPPDVRDKLTISVSATGAVTLPIEQREHLYQIAREAANNSIKHANASRITVALSVSPKEIKLFVEDDGCGFDPTRPHVGLGLDSLRLRAVALNGRLRIARRAIRGMIVHCSCAQP